MVLIYSDKNINNFTIKYIVVDFIIYNIIAFFEVSLIDQRFQVTHPQSKKIGGIIIYRYSALHIFVCLIINHIINM
jgi:hypothetical protein